MKLFELESGVVYFLKKLNLTPLLRKKKRKVLRVRGQNLIFLK